MKLTNISSKVAGKIIFRTSVMALLAGSSILTSCKKDNDPVATAANQGTETGIKAVNSSNNLVKDGGDGGYFYTNSYGGGTATMSSNGTNGGNFAVTWSGVNDGVWGKGWCTKAKFYEGTPDNTATSVPENRKVGYNLGSVSGDADHFGVYGWTQYPVIEYYVTEKGPGFTSNTQKNPITVDGHSYKVYLAHRSAGAGTPFGNSTTGFDQYIDIWGKQSTGVNGQVDMGQHIANWKTTFGNWGTMYMMILSVEGNNYGQPNGSSGSANATVWSNSVY